MLLLLWSKVLVVFVESFWEKKQYLPFFLFCLLVLFDFLKVKCICVEQKKGGNWQLKRFNFFLSFWYFCHREP